MSRIGKAPVVIPAGITIRIENQEIFIKGSKGELSKPIPREITVKQVDSEVVIERSSDLPKVRALHGLMRSLIDNMVKGVNEGFEKQLDLVGVGYRASKKGNGLEILVGYSKPVNVDKVDGIEFEVPVPTKIFIRGIDKEIVGQVAANIRRIRPPEPYKGKGIKYSDEIVRRKAGKTAKAGG